MLKQISNNNYIRSYVYKPVDFEKVKNEILDILNEKINENLIKIEINNELKKLHYNFSYNGTRYISEIIYEIYSKNDIYLDNLKKYIYPVIAKRHNTNINNIHCNIKQSTKCMYFDCPETKLKEYFNLSKTKKPKEKLVITTILNKIRKYYFS